MKTLDHSQMRASDRGAALVPPKASFHDPLFIPAEEASTASTASPIAAKPSPACRLHPCPPCSFAEGGGLEGVDAAR